MQTKHLTKKDLIKRWKTSERTIDRLRKTGKLPWLDLSGGQGMKPIVRFRIEDIKEYENLCLQASFVKKAA